MMDIMKNSKCERNFVMSWDANVVFRSSEPAQLLEGKGSAWQHPSVYRRPLGIKRKRERQKQAKRSQPPCNAETTRLRPEEHDAAASGGPKRVVRGTCHSSGHPPGRTTRKSPVSGHNSGNCRKIPLLNLYCLCVSKMIWREPASDAGQL